MADTRQGGGFHAFEQRVHQIEEADREAERKGQTKEGAGASREAKPVEKGGAKEPTRK